MESAKKRVTTYLSNLGWTKIEGGYLLLRGLHIGRLARGLRRSALVMGRGGTPGADLGSSSDYD